MLTLRALGLWRGDVQGLGRQKERERILGQEYGLDMSSGTLKAPGEGEVAMESEKDAEG